MEDGQRGNVARELQAAVDVRQVVCPVFEGGAGDDGVDAASGEHAGEAVAQACDGDHHCGIRPRIEALEVLQDALRSLMSGSDDGFGRDAEGGEVLRDRLREAGIGGGSEEKDGEHGRKHSKGGAGRL